MARRISPQKKRYTPHSMEQSMVRKDWPMRKVKSMLMVTLMDWPADRVSKGWISEGINHPRGPKPHAWPAMKIHLQQTCLTQRHAFCTRAHDWSHCSSCRCDNPTLRPHASFVRSAKQKEAFGANHSKVPHKTILAPRLAGWLAATGSSPERIEYALCVPTGSSTQACLLRTLDAFDSDLRSSHSH